MKNEEDVKSRLIKVMSDKFNIRSEVTGSYPVDDGSTPNVIIDFLIKYKEGEYKDLVIGVECKYFDREPSHSYLAKSYAQAISYSKSKFLLKDYSEVVPDIVLLHSNYELGAHVKYDNEKYLAYYFNTGALNITGDEYIYQMTTGQHNIFHRGTFRNGGFKKCIKRRWGNI